MVFVNQTSTVLSPSYPSASPRLVWPRALLTTRVPRPPGASSIQSWRQCRWPWIHRSASAAASYFNNRKVSIYGGSNEVQRVIISGTILGL